MPTTIFYPHKFGDEQISLTLDTNGINIPRSSAKAYECFDTDIDSFELTFQAAIGYDNLLELVPETIDVESVVKLVLIRESTDSRVRDAVNFDTISGGYKKLTFHKSEWSGEVLISAAVIRYASSTKSSEGYGTMPGNILATSETIRILFDPPQSPPGVYLDTRWISFKNGLRRMQERKNNLFALDISESIPTLYLNSDKKDLHSILHATGNNGFTAAARDALLGAIHIQVMSSLLSEAINQLRSECEKDTELFQQSEISQLLSGWQGQLLESWAPDLFPEVKGNDESIEKLKGAIQESGLISDLIAHRIGDALQRNNPLEDGFNSLVKIARR